jgi:hypothetical protein
MIDYERARALAADADPATRRRLAERADVQPEILYFLAEDAEPEIRATIAANAVTPRQADLVLARDTDVGVRERLAHKIGPLAPSLSGEERAHIRALTLEVIGILAADRTARIRRPMPLHARRPIALRFDRPQRPLRPDQSAPAQAPRRTPNRQFFPLILKLEPDHFDAAILDRAHHQFDLAQAHPVADHGDLAQPLMHEVGESLAAAVIPEIETVDHGELVRPAIA